jgi:hypothetical protein
MCLDLALGEKGHDQNNRTLEICSRDPKVKLAKPKEPASEYSNCFLTGSEFHTMLCMFSLIMTIFLFEIMILNYVCQSRQMIRLYQQDQEYILANIPGY